MITNRILGLTVLLAVIVAPLAAFLATTVMADQKEQHILAPKTQSISTVKQALDRENGYLPTNERLKDITVNSIKRYDSVWYIANVTYTDPNINESQKSIALIGDLHGNPNNLTVILKPEEVFPNVNISAGIGVPYDVVDKVNTFYNDRDGEGR